MVYFLSGRILYELWQYSTTTKVGMICGKCEGVEMEHRIDCVTGTIFYSFSSYLRGFNQFFNNEIKLIF